MSERCLLSRVHPGMVGSVYKLDDSHCTRLVGWWVGGLEDWWIEMTWSEGGHWFYPTLEDQLALAVRMMEMEMEMEMEMDWQLYQKPSQCPTRHLIIIPAMEPLVAI